MEFPWMDYLLSLFALMALSVAISFVRSFAGKQGDDSRNGDATANRKDGPPR